MSSASAPPARAGTRITDFDAAMDRLFLGRGEILSVLTNGDSTLLIHSGGAIDIEGVTGLSLEDWNALVLPPPAADPMLAVSADDYLSV